LNKFVYTIPTIIVITFLLITPTFQPAFAIQTILPNGSVDEDWTLNPSNCDASSNSHECVDEAVSDDDTTYLSTITVGDQFVGELDTMTDPEVGTGHEVHIWALSDAGASGQNERVDVFLLEITTTRCNFQNVVMVRSASYTEHTLTCSEAEANAISNYEDLRIGLRTDRVGSGEFIRVTKAELQIPDAPTGDVNDGIQQSMGGFFWNIPVLNDFFLPDAHGDITAEGVTITTTTAVITIDNRLTFDTLQVEGDGFTTRRTESDNLRKFTFFRGGSTVSYNLDWTHVQPLDPQYRFDLTEIITSGRLDVTGSQFAKVEGDDEILDFDYDGTANIIDFASHQKVELFLFPIPIASGGGGGGGGAGFVQPREALDLLIEAVEMNSIGLDSTRTFEFQISWKPDQTDIIDVINIEPVLVGGDGLTVVPMAVNGEEITIFNPLILVCDDITADLCTQDIMFTVETPEELCNIDGTNTARCVDYKNYDIRFDVLARAKDFFSTGVSIDHVVRVTPFGINLVFLALFLGGMTVSGGTTLAVIHRKRNVKRQVNQAINKNVKSKWKFDIENRKKSSSPTKIEKEVEKAMNKIIKEKKWNIKIESKSDSPSKIAKDVKKALK